MINYSKDEIIKLAFDDKKTIWDLFELFKVANDKEYYRFIHDIFGDDMIGYTTFADQVSLNNKKYRINHTIPKGISPEELIKMAENGKNRIDFMRMLGINGTSKFYKMAKEVFGRDEYEYDIFISKVKENTAKFLGDSIEKAKATKKQNKLKGNNQVAYLYSIDYLYMYKDCENFSIPLSQESYILSLAIKYFSSNPFLKSISSKIAELINKNSNVELITEESTFDFVERINISDEPHSVSGMFNILQNNVSGACHTPICAVDNDLLILDALKLKSQGKKPIVVTSNVITQRNLQYFGIASMPACIYNLDDGILSLQDKMLLPKEANPLLPCICFDASYVLSKKDEFFSYLCSMDSIKVIFSTIYDDIIEYFMKKSGFNASDELMLKKILYSICYAVSFNPTVKFIPVSGTSSGLYSFNSSIILNNTINLSRVYNDITIASTNSNLVTTANLMGIKVIM